MRASSEVFKIDFYLRPTRIGETVVDHTFRSVYRVDLAFTEGAESWNSEFVGNIGILDRTDGEGRATPPVMLFDGITFSNADR